MKNTIIHFLVGTFVLLLVVINITTEVKAHYEDVPPTHSNYEDVMFLVERNIIGNKDVIFNYQRLTPSTGVRRFEAIGLIGIALGLDSTPRETQFIDVFDDIRGGYIQSAVDAGIVKGYEDGTFKPYLPVNRGHAATFIYRAFDLPKGTKTFKDVPVGHTAYEAVSALEAANITTGYDDNTFRPNEGLTRAHLITLVARAIKYKENNQ